MIHIMEDLGKSHQSIQKFEEKKTLYYYDFRTDQGKGVLQIASGWKRGFEREPRSAISTPLLETCN